MLDISHLSFSSTAPTPDAPPTLSLSVSLSPAFSKARSINVLYWAYGHEQTWIPLSRQSADEAFTRTIALSPFARSGTYEIREIVLVDDAGLRVELSSEQLRERGFDVTTELQNPNADSVAPTISILDLAEPVFDAQGRIHVQVSVQASDDASGLKRPFIVEFTSPTGKSLQQWAYLDDRGHADVDFVFSEFSASGVYRINTIRIEDQAGNLTHGGAFLGANPRSVTFDNPSSDAVVPDLLDFKLTAVFDPVANRPKILIEAASADKVSGVTGVYLRLWSPEDSKGGNLDKWLSFKSTGNGLQQVEVSDYLALPSDYSSGQYNVGFVMLNDGAGNEIILSRQALEARGFDGAIRVYFPESLPVDRRTEVYGSANADYVFGSDTTSDALAGGAGSDFLYAGKGDDSVDGGDGDDMIVGGDGAGNDRYEGGTGSDTVKYASALAGIAVNLATGHASSLSTATPDSAGIGNDILSGIENVIGGNYADTIVGNSAANVLDGGGGNDQMAGGAGNDTYYVSNAGDQIIERPQEGTDLVNSSLSAHTLAANVENGRVYTRANANLTGNALSNTLYAGAGNNVLKGEGGTDAVSYAYATSAVTVSLAVTTAQATGGSGIDTLASIENLNGSIYNDTLTGNSGANVIYGSLGADRMSGGDGSDVYYVDDAGDVVIETNASAAGGIDEIRTTRSLFLGANIENVLLLSVTSSATGNALANRMTGSKGTNYLNGGAGNDVLTGGSGADFFSFSTALNYTTNVDRITDFGADDTIRLDNAVFTKLALGALKASNFKVLGTSARDADDYILYDKATGALYYDADGWGGNQGVKFAIIGANLDLGTADFIVY